MQTFEDLEVWKKAREFRKEIAIVSKSFPQDERYQLTSQIIRSSRSISANIVEGYGRYYYKENIHFCRVAKGSLMETLDHLVTALEENYIDNTTYDKLRELYQHVLKLLNGYILYLKNKKDGKDEKEE